MGEERVCEGARLLPQDNPMKRVFIVHCWAGTPEMYWYSWLASELEKRGCEVHVLAMPDTDSPEIGAWVSHLKESIGTLDDNTFFIGHSVGCQTILRYLETQKTPCGGALFVAGWFTLQGLETQEEEKIAHPWLETPIQFEKAKKNLPESVALFSDNDPLVPLDNKDVFRAHLGSHVAIEHDKGHFDNITKLPSALNAFVKLARL